MDAYGRVPIYLLIADEDRSTWAELLRRGQTDPHSRYETISICALTVDSSKEYADPGPARRPRYS